MIASRRARIGWSLLASYGLLLAISHGARLAQRPAPPDPPNGSTLTLDAGDARTPVVLRTSLWSPPEPQSPINLLVLPGPPRGGPATPEIAAALGTRFQVLLLHLPELSSGARTDSFDLSFRAQAGYVLQALDALAVDRVHALGSGAGGPVALRFYDLAPERVDSTILFSPTEFPRGGLVDEPQIHRLVREIQLICLWVALEAVPHMGTLDGVLPSRGYLQTLRDSDPSDLPDILSRHIPPLLEIYDPADPTSTVEASLERVRRASHGELARLDPAARTPRDIAERIEEWVSQAGPGETPRLGQTTPEPTIAAREPGGSSGPRKTTPRGTAVLLGILVLACVLVSEDLTCVAVGLMVARGSIDFGLGALGCFLGILTGDFLWFFAGRWLGRPALPHRPLRWLLRGEDISKASGWFRRRGPLVIFASRCIPGTRAATCFTSGVLGSRAPVFLMCFVAAAALWAPSLVGVSALVGSRVGTVFGSLGATAPFFLVTTALGLFALFHLLIPLLTVQGRELLRRRARRLGARFSSRFRPDPCSSGE